MAVLRKQRVRYEPIDRAAAKGDRVTIDFLGKKDGEPFQGGEAKDYPFVLGEGTMLAGFEGAVTGLKAGESKTFEMTFPADYAKELAGRRSLRYYRQGSPRSHPARSRCYVCQVAWC